MFTLYFSGRTLVHSTRVFELCSLFLVRDFIILVALFQILLFVYGELCYVTELKYIHLIR